jgi:hypothetical protein
MHRLTSLTVLDDKPAHYWCISSSFSIKTTIYNIAKNCESIEHFFRGSAILLVDTVLLNISKLFE